METFGTRLRAAMDSRGSLCVGIDPHPALLTRWGLPETSDGLAEFAGTVAEALADRAAVIKPQSAFFERFGAAGIAVLESTIRQCRAAGALVLLDVKRGDVGSTAQAYARAYLNPQAPLYVDAITASPYLGFGSMQPILDEAHAHGGGVFVLALTSNPEGPQVQHSRTSDGVTVAQKMINEVAARNAGAVPMGSVGVVVGVTVGDTGHDLSRLNGPILAPGLGAQGGTADDLRTIFHGVEKSVLPSYSREILARGPGVLGLREAFERALDDCQKVLK